MPDDTCKKCGTKTSDEFRFCFNCGNPLVLKKTPSEIRQGAVVGGLVGLLYGIFYTVNLYLVYPVISASLLNSAPAFVSSTQVPLVVGIPITFGLLGCISGVVFVKFRKHILGTSIIEKSVIFGFILMTISLILGFTRRVEGPAIHLTTAQYTLEIILVVANLVALPLLGWLFGFLLQRRLMPKGVNQANGSNT